MRKQFDFFRGNTRKGASKRTLAALSLMSLVAQCAPASAQVHPASSSHMTRPGAKDNTPLITGENLSGSQVAQQLNSGAKYFKLETSTPIIGDLVIPKGVTLVNLVAGSTSILNVTGNLIDSGKLIFRTSNPAVDQANLAATNVTVNPGALISSLNNLSLNIHALNNIVNGGTISSAANLNLSAGGSIINALPSGVAGAAPVMQAVQNLTMSTGAGIITNAGLISSANGNVNINSVTANQSLRIDNVLGSIQAANAINVRDALYTGTGNININGGNLISQTLNLNSGKGTVDVIAENISGVVNITACNAHVGALSTPNLKLGDLNVSGDPTYFNTGGDVSITSNISTSGADLAILASGNVSIAGANIDTTGSGNAGNLLIVAGADLSGAASGQVNNDNSTTITIANGAGTGGGSISGGNVTVDAKSSILTKGTSNGNGGTVQVYAYSGLASDGTVEIDASIASGANGSGKNGSVTIIAPGKLGADAITVGAIDTSGSTASTASGTITLTSGAPTITGGNISVLNGTPSGGTFIAGSIGFGNIKTTGGLNTNGSGIQLATEGNISIGGDVKTDAEPSSFTQNAGSIALLAGGDIAALGKTQRSFSSTSFNNGGDITLLAGVALTADNTTASKVTATGASSSGGDIDYGTSAGGPGATFNTATGKASFGNSGAFRALAFNGSGGTKGHVALLTGATSVNTGSPSNQDSSGEITITAGASSGNGIVAGKLDSRQGNGAPFSGRVTLNTATPTFSSSITFQNGKSLSTGYGVGTVQPSSIVVGDIVSPGGDITLNAGANLTLTGGINVVPISPFGAVNVNLTAANTLTVQGGLAGQVQVNGFRSGASISANVIVSASNIVVNGTGPWLVNADSQAGTGNGGKISITQNNTSSLNIGSATSGNNIQLSAVGGSTGGSGGSITLSSGGDLVVDTSAITAAPNSSGNGNGAQFIFAAGSSSSGNLKITGSLDANGKNTGNGGVISLTSNSSSDFVINSSTGNFINGSLTANAGTSGNAGSITVINNGSGGVTTNTPSSDISVLAGIGGNGGTIDLESMKGTVKVGNGVLSVDPVGAGSGGKLILKGGALSFSSSGFGLLASASNGTIIIYSATAPTTTINSVNSFSGKNIELVSVAGGFSLGANTINASSSVALVTKNSITSITGIAFAPSMVLVSSGGNIGTDNTTGRLAIGATSVTLSAASGNVWVTDTPGGNDVNIQDATLLSGGTYTNNAKTYSFYAAGIGTGNNVKTTGSVSITGNDVDLTSGGGFALSGPVSATNSAAFISADSILPASISSLTANSVVLVANGSGANIGLDENNRVNISATSITAQSLSGSVFLKTSTAGDVSGNVNLVNSTINGIAYTNSAAATYSLRAVGISSGEIKVSSGISAADLILTSSGGISASSNISATNSIALISNNSLTSFSGLTAPNIVLAATGTFSGIGSNSGSGRLLISSPNVTLSAPGFASIWVSDSSTGDLSGNINIVNASVEGSAFTNKAGLQYSFIAPAISSGKVIATQSGVDISATDIDLKSNGAFSFGGNLTGSNSIALISNDAITSFGLGSVSAPNLVLAATGANATIGTSSLSRLAIDASAVTLSATFGVFVIDVSTGDKVGNVSLLDTTVNGITYSNSAGSIYSFIANKTSSGTLVVTSGSQINGDMVDVTSSSGITQLGTISGATSVALVSANSILNIGNVNTKNLTLATTGKGSTIGSDASNRLSVSASSLTASSEAVFITDTSVGTSSGFLDLQDSSVNGVLFHNQASTGSFSIVANGLTSGKTLRAFSTVSAGTDLVLQSTGGIKILSTIQGASSIALISNDSILNSNLTPGSMSTPRLVIAALGAKASLGSSAVPLQIDVPNLTAQALNGSVFISNATTGDVSGNSNIVNAMVEGASYFNGAANTWSLFSNNIAQGKQVVTQPGVNIVADKIEVYSGGGLAFDGDLTGTTQISLISDDSITSAGLSGKLNTNTLLLSVLDSTSDIGVSSVSRLTVDAANLSLSGRNVWVTNISKGDGNGDVNLITGTAFGAPYANQATATYSLITNGLSSGKALQSALGVDVSGKDIELQSSGTFALAGNLTATNSIALVSNDSITSLANVSAPSVVLAATGAGADIGQQSKNLVIDASNFTFSAANGSVYVTSTTAGAVNLVDSTAFGSKYTNTAANTYHVQAVGGGLLSTKSAVVSAPTIEIASVGDLEVTGANLKGSSIGLAASGNLNITDNTITAAPHADGSGGILLLSSSTFSGGLNQAFILTANAADSGANPQGGSVTILSQSSITVGNGVGNFNISASAGQGASDLGSGGTIDISLLTAGKTLSVDPAFLSAKTGTLGGNGATIQLASLGNIDFPGSSTLNASAKGTGKFNGGTIQLSGDKITFNGVQTLVLLADGSDTGNGGTVQINSANAASDYTIGVAAGNVSISILSGANGGDAGIVQALSGGKLTFNSAGLASSVGTAGNGAQVTVTASGALTIADSSFSVDGAGNGNGGLIHFEGASISKTNLSLSAVAAGTGNGGTIEYIVNGNTDLSINASTGLSLLANGGSTTGDGGSISVKTGGKLSVDTAALDAAPLGTNGKGATLVLAGTTVSKLGGGRLNLSAPGKGLGDGGKVSLTQTTTLAQTIGTAPSSNYFLSASAGVGGGSGGTVDFTTGGNLTVDPTGIDVTSLSPNTTELANGGTISLKSGANLFISGNLSANSAGSNALSTGGSITLQSNSSTPFLIGTGTTNGIKGLLTVSGVASNGTISVTNMGGAITDGQKSMDAKSISFITGKNGNILINGTLGNAATSQVGFSANGKGSITSSQKIQSAVISANSGSGAISLTKINVGTPTSVSIETLTPNTVTLTGSIESPQVASSLTLTGVNGTTVNVSTPGSLVVANPVSGTTVSLKSTGTTNQTVDINSPVSATAGNLTISAPGTVIVGRALSASAVISISSTNGDIISHDNIESTTTKGSIALLSSKGSITATADLSAFIKVSLSAVKGTVSLASVGQSATTNALDVVSLSGISNNGAINVTNTVTEKTTGNNAIIVVNDDIVASSATSTVSLSTTGTGSDIRTTNPSHDVSAGKSVSLNASKGIVVVDSTIGANNGSLNLISLIGTSVTENGLISASGNAKVTITATAAGGDINIGGNADLSSGSNSYNISGGDVSINVQSNIGSLATPLTLSAKNSLSITTPNDAFVKNTAAASATAPFDFKNSSAGGTLKLIANGSFKISTATASALDLSGANITVDSLVGGSSTASVSLTAIGSGTITQKSGSVVADSSTGVITLKSTSGSIGGTSALAVNAPTVNIATTGDVKINSLLLSALTVNTSSSPAKGFAVSALQDLSIGTLTSPSSITLSTTAGNISLQGNIGKSTTTLVSLTAGASGSILANGKSITGAGVSLATTSTDIGSSLTPFTVTAGNNLQVVAGGAALANVLNLGTTPLTLKTSSAGGAFTLSTASNLTVNGAFAGANQDLSISATGTNHSIIVAGPISASNAAKVSLKASGTGAITRTTGSSSLIQGGSVNLQSGTGSIGTSTLGLLLQDVSNLGIFTSGNALVNVSGTVNSTSNNLTVVNGSTFGSGAVTISSQTGLTVQQAISTAGNITLSTTADNGSLTLGANLTSTGGSGVINLTSNGSGVVSQSTASTIKASTVNLKTGTDGTIGTNIKALFIDATNFSGNASGTGLVNLSNSRSTATSLTSSSAGSGGFVLNSSSSLAKLASISVSGGPVTLLASNGGFIMAGAIGGATANSISVTATNGSITQSGSAAIQGSSVNLTVSGATGSIGNSTALNINTPSFAASTGIGGTGVVNLNNTFSGASVLGNSNSAGAFTLKTAGSITLNGILAGNGSVAGNISVTASKGILQTANGAVLASTGGFLTLLNADKNLGSIVIGAGSQLTTSGPTGKNVSILIGGTTTTRGPALPNINYSVNGVSVPANNLPANTFFFGTNGISATNQSTIDLNVLGGAKVIFNTGTQGAGAITVNGSGTSTHTVITADPPVSLAPAAMPIPPMNANAMGKGSSNQLPQFNSFGSSEANSKSGSASVGVGSSSGNGNGVAFGSGIDSNYSLGHVSGLSSNANANVISSTNSLRFASFSTASPVALNKSGELISPALRTFIPSSNLSATRSSTGSVLGSTSACMSTPGSTTNSSNASSSGSYNSAANSSDASLSDSFNTGTSNTYAGEIPAVVYSDLDMGLEANNANVMGVKSPQKTILEAGKSTLEASISKNGDGIRKLQIKDACALIAPRFDSVIETKFGKLNLASGSLVLLIQQAGKMAIYDLDDSHGKAVSFTSNRQTLHLYPGLAIVVSSSIRDGFEQANPAETFCYRDIESHELTSGHQTFSAEFSIPTAIKSIAPLKQLFASRHHNARKLAEHLLKTIVATQQTKKGERFQPVLRSTQTAWLK